MANLELTYRAIGTIEGKIWWPNNGTFTKEFDIVFSKGDEPFTTKFESLQDIKNQITNDGDFQSCNIVDGELIITANFSNKKQVTRYLSLV